MAFERTMDSDLTATTNDTQVAPIQEVVMVAPVQEVVMAVPIQEITMVTHVQNIDLDIPVQNNMSVSRKVAIDGIKVHRPLESPLTNGKMNVPQQLSMDNHFAEPRHNSSKDSCCDFFGFLCGCLQECFCPRCCCGSSSNTYTIPDHLTATIPIVVVVLIVVIVNVTSVVVIAIANVTSVVAALINFHISFFYNRVV